MMALAIALATGGLTAAADAASRYRDHVYADSFGNLIVYSRAGYKRIVVARVTSPSSSPVARKPVTGAPSISTISKTPGSWSGATGRRSS